MAHNVITLWHWDTRLTTILPRALNGYDRLVSEIDIRYKYTNNALRFIRSSRIRILGYVNKDSSPGEESQFLATFFFDLRQEPIEFLHTQHFSWTDTIGFAAAAVKYGEHDLDRSDIGPDPRNELEMQVSALRTVIMCLVDQDAHDCGRVLSAIERSRYEEVEVGRTVIDKLGEEKLMAVLYPESVGRDGRPRLVEM